MQKKNTNNNDNEGGGDEPTIMTKSSSEEPKNLAVLDGSDRTTTNSGSTPTAAPSTSPSPLQQRPQQKLIMLPVTRKARQGWRGPKKDTTTTSSSSNQTTGTQPATVPGATQVGPAAPRGLRRRDEDDKFRVNTSPVYTAQVDEDNEDDSIKSSDPPLHHEDENPPVHHPDQEEKEEGNLVERGERGNTHIVEARLVTEHSHRESLQEQQEDDNILTIQDAVPVSKLHSWRFGLLLVCIIVIVAIIATAVGVTVGRRGGNDTTNGGDADDISKNDNTVDKELECAMSFNNKDSMCAVLLNGVPPKEATTCNCLNFCDGAFVGCNEAPQCSGIVVAGCKSTNQTPLFPLILDAQRLAPLTLLALTDATSLQSSAYRWVQEHPQLKTMSMDRKLQLFSLAMLYKSTQPWNDEAQERWMDVDVHECNWGTEIVNASINIWKFGADCDAQGLYRSIDIDQSGMVGTLPLEFFLLTGLTYISLFTNKLRGRLPSEIGALTGLTNLFMAVNNLEGTLPTELGLLTKLTYMDFHLNGLKGPIPSEVGLLTALTLLSVHNNNLSGELPSQELAQLTQLSELEVYDTQLFGTIPLSFCNLTTWTSGITVDLNNGVECTCPPEICRNKR